MLLPSGTGRITQLDRNGWFMAGGVSSIAVAALHVGMVFFGASAYRYFGAGEEMARMSEAGSPIPALVTLAAAAVFLVWGLYAFSALGWIPRLPLQRLGLVTISAVYVLRGLGFIPQLILRSRPSMAITDRDIVFSLASLLIGIFFALGTWRSRADIANARS